VTFRQFTEQIRTRWMQAMLAVVLILPLAIGLSLVVKSWPMLGFSTLPGILTGTEWQPMQGKFGLWPFIFSSVLTAVVGMVVMIPLALASAIYITQFAPRFVERALVLVIDILAGIPSVIFGLWGVLFIVPEVANWAKASGAGNTSGYSILAGAVVMSFSVLPFVLNMLIELFRTVSIELKEAALSLGISHWQVVKDVILRKIKPGITAAFSLGVSKSFGETIAVLMVVGNVVQMPTGLFDAGYPLPALLANNYGEMMSIPQYDAALMLSALLLLIIVVVFNSLAHQLIRHYQTKA